MKKYLMTAMAAVAMGATFTSCSHNTDLYGGGENGETNGRTAEEQAELVKAVYNAAFEQSFGKVAPTVDWGFGSSTRALTRSGNTGKTYAYTHGDENGGANMNHNEWADPDKKFGGWVVPDPLTAEQKAVVTAYFQSGPDIDFEDPHFRHFFVQQVYKGGSAQAGASTENITAADNSVYNSDNMNLLTVGETNIHINDYNAGTCSESDVLNNGQKVGGTSHKDQITLMVNIDDTSCFGYHETGSSTHHNNKAAIVGWETIDTWAKTNYTGYNGCLKDDWNRSFMGFDLALKEGAEAYDRDQAGNINYATYDQAPESPQYAWDGEKIVPITTGEWKNVTIQHEYWTENKNVPVYKEGFESIMGCGWLTTNENFYVAEEKVTLDQSFQVNGTPANLDGIKNAVILKEFTVDGTKYQSVINLPRIKQLVDAGYLPVKDKSLQEWVKVGTSDGYFTDWIVTLTEAKRIDEEIQDTPTYRVIAEDLDANEASDFDFNDVVFDVEPNEAGTAAKIVVRAAGGIYKLTVAGEEVHAAFGEGVKDDGLYPMINTQPWNPDVKATLIESYSGDFSSDAAIRNTIKNIEIKVYKPGFEENGIELPAQTGKPACKILVDQTFNVVTERTGIADENTNFHKYVQGTWDTDTNGFWWKKNK